MLGRNFSRSWLVRTAFHALENTTERGCCDHENMISAAGSMVKSKKTADSEEGSTATSSSPPAYLALLCRKILHIYKYIGNTQI